MSLEEVEKAYVSVMEYFGHTVGPKEDWAGPLEEEFRKADANGDGQLGKKEIGGYIFDLIDSNDDGEISLEEMYTAIEHVAAFTGNTLKKDWKKQVEEALSPSDYDKSGGASKKEIMKFIHEHGIPNINDLFEK